MIMDDSKQERTFGQRYLERAAFLVLAFYAQQLWDVSNTVFAAVASSEGRLGSL